MRKNIFLMSFLFLHFSAPSQELKSKFLLNGGFDFNIQKPQNSNLYQFGIKPSLLYFFNEKFAVGLDVGYAYRLNESSRNSRILSHTTTFGPKFRFNYYRKEKFGFFLELRSPFQYALIKNSSVFDANKMGFLSVGLNLSPGIYYLLTEKIFLEASLSGIFTSFNLGSFRNGESTEVVNYMDIRGDFQPNFSSFKIGWLF
jgi:hypothetical protein